MRAKRPAVQNQRMRFCAAERLALQETPSLRIQCGGQVPSLYSTITRD